MVYGGCTVLLRHAVDTVVGASQAILSFLEASDCTGYLETGSQAQTTTPYLQVGRNT